MAAPSLTPSFLNPTFSTCASKVISRWREMASRSRGRLLLRVRGFELLGFSNSRGTEWICRGSPAPQLVAPQTHTTLYPPAEIPVESRRTGEAVEALRAGRSRVYRRSSWEQCALSNMTDELTRLQREGGVGGSITESWLHADIPDTVHSLNGFTLLRGDQRGRTRAWRWL